MNKTIKKAVFPLMALAFIIICAILVYREREAVPAYVEIISTLEVKVEKADIPKESEKIKNININTAGLDELMTLQGVGPVVGQRIIDYREYNGLFMSIEEIMEVSGIGEKIFENIKDRITIG